MCKSWIGVLLSLVLVARAEESELARKRLICDQQLAKIDVECKKASEKWPEQYLQALKMLEVKFQKEGELDAILVVRKEAERFSVAKAIPPEAFVETPQELRDLQERSTKGSGDPDVERYKQVLALLAKYEDSLGTLKQSLTQKGLIDEAIAVDSEIDMLPIRPEMVAARIGLRLAGVEPEEAGGVKAEEPIKAVPEKVGAEVERNKARPTPEPPVQPRKGDRSRLKLTFPMHRRYDFSQSSQQLFQTLAERIVTIRTGSSGGSGVCITDDGYVLTCYHVVEGNAGRIMVTYFAKADGKISKAGEKAATIVFQDPDQDVAVLKVDKPSATMKGVSIAKTDSAPGTKVYAIGSPGLAGQVFDQSITEGLVSASDRDLGGYKFLQHSAAINPGNSGGPLLNMNGEIVGLVMLKARMENVGFAIPASRLRDILSEAK